MTTLVRPSPSELTREAAGGDHAIVELEFAPEARPAWLTDGARLHVPMPRRGFSPLMAGLVLVWGRTGTGRRLPIAAVSGGVLQLACPWDRWQAHILTERYATWRRRPLHTRLPVSYRSVPPRLRSLVAQRMCTRRASDYGAFPTPPFDGGFEALRGLVRSYSVADVPDPPSPRLCLTHDIDTAEGFRFVKEIATVESALGLRSCWNVVAHGYRIDHRVCDWLVQEGFEIGLHGYCHDNKLIYLPESRLRRRLDACRLFMDRYRVRGFRSPSWFRNAQLMRVLADYVDYDGSCLDFDWLCPAGRGGVLTATPFRFGRLVEIPATLPFEAPVLAGCEPSGVVDYWRPKIDWLRHVGGHAVVNTHPDPHYSGNGPMIRAYAHLLEELLAAYEGRWSLPRDLAAEVAAHA